MDSRTPLLVVANWKMNPRTLGAARELLRDITKVIRGKRGVVVVPPTPFLTELIKTARSTALAFGAQDLSQHGVGAHTGEIGASMLKSIGVSYVIVGHSERRGDGETDGVIHEKLRQALAGGITPILCVGERERDSQGKYFSVVEEQVRTALREVPARKIGQVIIAYEPLWAISTASAAPRPATPEDAHEMTLFIRKTLTDLYDRVHARKVRILYGGSVDAKNIQGLVAGSGAQGFLVGGASLRPDDFKGIITTTHGS